MAITPGSTETAEMMFGCLKRMGRLIDAELSEVGLSLSRTKLLCELRNNGPLNQSALAVTFGLAPRTVTELVDTLERDGLVERRPDPGDRRARHVHLTPAGEQARARGMAIKKQLTDRVLGALSDEQRTSLSSTMHLILVEIDKIDADNTPTDGNAHKNVS